MCAIENVEPNLKEQHSPCQQQALLVHNQKRTLSEHREEINYY